MNKNKELLPYYEKAKDIFDYDSNTGELVRSVTTSSNSKKGDVAGCLNKSGYLVTSITLNGVSKNFYNHRICWYIYHNSIPQYIDHIDCNKINNRIDNLRPCTSSQNNSNKGLRKDNTSGIKGVSWNKLNKNWRVRICKDGNRYDCGSYKAMNEAVKVYEKKARELFGEFYHKS